MRTFILLLATILIATPAHALQCGKRDVMTNVLEKRFKETRFAIGLASPVIMIEVYVSKKGTWTILSTRAGGKACVLAAGKSWANMPVKPVGDNL